MSDISSWSELIRRETPKEYVGAPGCGFSSYAVVPLCEYQMGNLLGLLKRSADKNNGDWFDELICVIQTTMKKLDIKELRSNFGDVFVYDASDPWCIMKQVGGA